MILLTEGLRLGCGTSREGTSGAADRVALRGASGEAALGPETRAPRCASGRAARPARAGYEGVHVLLRSHERESPCGGIVRAPARLRPFRGARSRISSRFRDDLATRGAGSCRAGESRAACASASPITWLGATPLLSAGSAHGPRGSCGDPCRHHPDAAVGEVNGARTPFLLETRPAQAGRAMPVRRPRIGRFVVVLAGCVDCRSRRQRPCG